MTMPQKGNVLDLFSYMPQKDNFSNKSSLTVPTSSLVFIFSFTKISVKYHYNNISLPLAQGFFFKKFNIFFRLEHLFWPLPPQHPLDHSSGQHRSLGTSKSMVTFMVVFHLLTFIESNLQRREYHFVYSQHV